MEYRNDRHTFKERKKPESERRLPRTFTNTMERNSTSFGTGQLPGTIITINIAPKGDGKYYCRGAGIQP